MIPIRLRLLIIIIFSTLAINACSGNSSLIIDLMPAPDIYGEDLINPFTDNNPIDELPYKGILYATDRAPAEESDKERFYGNDRGHVLRLGFGTFKLGQEGMTWEEARQVSLLKNRTEKYPLEITGVEEICILDRSSGIFTSPEFIQEDSRLQEKRYAALINEKLEDSRDKDIYLYVPGFKVAFENPLLVAGELWHYLGYEGVFMTFAWPSTPSVFAYASDTETTLYSARNLRILIRYLNEETDAERIHIIGYSAGTRVVLNALFQFLPKAETIDEQKPRLGDVILVGSDIDRDIFGGYVRDGILDLTETFSVYVSQKDKALSMSNWFFKHERLGQMLQDGNKMSSSAADFLHKTDKLDIIDVTDAQGATSGNGHAYFRKSPWVSSDILMNLMYNLSPEDRGLVKKEATPIWTFPDNYVHQLRSKLAELNLIFLQSGDVQ